MVIDFKNEVWLPYREENWSEEDEYLISNYGRIKRKKVFEEHWKLSKTSLVSGYPSFWISKKGKPITTSCYVHRVVAKAFLDKKEDQHYVIHIDFDKENNKVDNLKWVTKKELFIHHKKNPKKIRRKGQRTYSKLTEGRVRLIKKKIFDPNRRTRMRIIAKQFGISEMQLYRIKSGENWGSVKIET
ncbi:HNH endonuclease signature motif containing protein [Lutibacter sp.]